jgi:prepilin-type N-terminal cleavage/methylation domain-containing protein
MKQRQRGFTLLEMVLGLAIVAAVVTTIGMTITTLLLNYKQPSTQQILLQQVQNAGYQMPRDIQMSNSVVTASGGATAFPNIVTQSIGGISTNAFPNIVTQSTGRTPTTDTTSHSITMPGGITAGDLLICIFSVDGAPTCTASSGWTILGQASNVAVVTQAIFYKVAAGGDTLTITTSAAEQSSHIVLRIAGAGSTITGTPANGSSTNSNPPSHNAGSSQKYLWVATRGGDSTTVPTAIPTNYSSGTHYAAAGTGGASTSTATRQYEIQTEDPGTWTVATEEWVCWTLAIPPVTTDTTSHSITMPGGITAGDLLICIFSVDGAPTCTASSGWTILGQASNVAVVTQAIFYKVAAGGDTLTITTSAAEQSSHIVLRIAGAGSTITGTPANGSSTNSNPPSHNAGSSQKYLWVATRGGDSTTVPTAIPTNYSSGTHYAAAGTGGASTSTATRQYEIQTEDPGTWTVATEEWVCWTLAIPPAPAALYGFPITINIPVDQDTNNDYCVVYLLDGDKLKRQQFSSSDILISESVIAQYVDTVNTTIESPSDSLYKLTIRVSLDGETVTAFYEAQRRLTTE